MRLCARRAALWKRALAATRAAMSNPGCPAHYAAAMEKDMQALGEMRDLRDAQALRRALCEFKQARPAGRNRDGRSGGARGGKSPAQERRETRSSGRAWRICRWNRPGPTPLALYGVYPALAGHRAAHFCGA